MTAVPASCAPADDGQATVDAEISAVVPGIAPPRSVPGDVVLVIGPWLAGVSALTATLRRAMPEWRFAEQGELAPRVAPAAVVFAVSAVAPVAESDCALLDTAMRDTDGVLGALTKIDAHRTWRTVLTADARHIGSRTPRLREMPWVGVAAAPTRGAAQVDELVLLLRGILSDRSTPARNRLRAWESRLYDEIAAASQVVSDAESAALHRRREQMLRDARLARSQRSIVLRSRIQQARVQLGLFARDRNAAVRTELAEDAAAWSGLPFRRDRAEDFRATVAGRVADVVQEVDSGVTDHLRDIAGELSLAAPPVPATSPPPPRLEAPGLASRHLESQLMLLLGAGFGLGVALATSRLFAGLAPGWTAAGAIAAGLLGVGLTVWVVGIRGLLHDRALLERWVGRVAAALRDTTDAVVAARVLAAEEHFTAEAAAVEERAAAETARRVAAIDIRLRERALTAARDARTAERRLPELQAALVAVDDRLRRFNNQTNSVTAQ